MVVERGAGGGEGGIRQLPVRAHVMKACVQSSHLCNPYAPQLGTFHAQHARLTQHASTEHF